LLKYRVYWRAYGHTDVEAETPWDAGDKLEAMNLALTSSPPSEIVLEIVDGGFVDRLCECGNEMSLEETSDSTYYSCGECGKQAVYEGLPHASFSGGGYGVSDRDAEELLITARIGVSMAKKYGEDDPQYFGWGWTQALYEVSEEHGREDGKLNVLGDFVPVDGIRIQFEEERATRYVAKKL